MFRRVFALSFAVVLGLALSIPVLAQEGAGSSNEGSKGTASHAEQHKAGKQDRWEGIVIRSSKDKSTLTVRKVGSRMEKTVHYDSSTQFVSQEHGSKQVNQIDADQIHDNDRVICLGTFDDKGDLHATLISKRLSSPLSR